MVTIQGYSACPCAKPFVFKDYGEKATLAISVALRALFIEETSLKQSTFVFF
jgi:hypothetical protein